MAHRVARQGRQSGRSRKAIQRHVSYVVKEDAELKVPEGVGVPLGDIPNVSKKLDAISSGEPVLRKLHQLVFPGQSCKKLKLKKNLRQFKGLAKGENEEEQEILVSKLQMKFAKLPMPLVKKLIDLLDMHIEKPSQYNKQELCGLVNEFLFNPQPSGQDYRAFGAKKRKKKTPKKTPKKKKVKKSKKKSSIKRPPNTFFLFTKEARKRVQAEHPEATPSEQGKILGELWRALPEEEKEVYKQKAAVLKEEYNKKVAEEEKKNSKADKSKDEDKKSPEKKAATADEDEDGGSSAEEPLSKKIKTDIVETLKDDIRNILKDGDLDSLSVKKIRSQLKEKHGDESVTKHKSMIKEFINAELEKL